MNDRVDPAHFQSRTSQLEHAARRAAQRDRQPDDGRDHLAPLLAPRDSEGRARRLRHLGHRQPARPSRGRQSQGRGDFRLQLHRARRPASTPTITSPRATTPTCCCGGATRSSPTRRPSIRPRKRRTSQRRQFGYNNDFIGYVPLEGSSEHGLLLVNHEYTDAQLMFPGIVTIVEKEGKKVIETAPLTKEQVDIEMAAHGDTIVEIRKVDGKWQVVTDSPYNRRITADTEMEVTGPAAGHDRLKTSADASGTKVLGTVNNCAGGVSPWGTYITAEENFHGYFSGELPADHRGGGGLRALRRARGRLRVGEPLRPLRRQQGAERAEPLRLDRRDRSDGRELRAEEAHRARPHQARGRRVDRGEGRTRRLLSRRRRALRLRLQVRDERHVQSRRPRRQHEPSRFRHALRREVLRRRQR